MAESTFTSAMSFTTRPTRKPWRLVSMYVSRVVFPAPRNPEISVTGMVLGGDVEVAIVDIEITFVEENFW